MLKALLILTVAGLLGLAGLSLLVALGIPLLFFGLKVLVVLLVGYLVLWLFFPELADECRTRLRGRRSEAPFAGRDGD